MSIKSNDHVPPSTIYIPGMHWLVVALMLRIWLLLQQLGKLLKDASRPLALSWSYSVEIERGGD